MADCLFPAQSDPEMKASAANRILTGAVLPALVVLAATTTLAIANPGKTRNGPPARIATPDLTEFKELPAGRQQLVGIALALASNPPWLPYLHGGADPARGGLDCSGAMHYVMIRAGLAPPRTSAGQYRWLRDHQRLHLVPNEATTADHPSLAGLRPGDLLFWSTAPPGPAAEIVLITHVAMYLGREKKDGLRIMANATEGRTYRGTKATGYGVYDFRLPRGDSTSKLVGYGTPPGLATDPKKENEKQQGGSFYH